MPLENTTYEIDVVKSDLLRIKIKVTSENKLVSNEYIYHINITSIDKSLPTTITDLY